MILQNYDGFDADGDQANGAADALPCRGGQSEVRIMLKTPFPEARDNSKPRLNILSAEDHPGNQLLISLLLKKLNCSCHISGNGLEALEALISAKNQRQFDLVLMDINMPVMDGFEAARAIRALPGRVSQLPILAVTGDAPDAIRGLAFAAGMNDILTKPLDVRAFAAALDYWGKAARKPHGI